MARVQRALQWTPERDAEIIRRYAAGETGQVIADHFGVCRSTILRRLPRLGAKARTNSEAQTKHTLRHDAFDVLTPDAAYWCGFLFTDGSVSHRPGQTPEVSVGLSECDLGHIEKLRAFLGSTHAITPMKARPMTFKAGAYISKAACRYSVRSAKLADRLCALGRYDGPVDEGLVQSRDFWRGAMDGDGTIGISGGYPYLHLVGSRRLMEAYVRFLGHTGTRSLHVQPHKMIFSVNASGATAARIIDRLYLQASPVLDRKASRAARIHAWSLAAERPLPGLEMLGA